MVKRSSTRSSTIDELLSAPGPEPILQPPSTRETCLLRCEHLDARLFIAVLGRRYPADTVATPGQRARVAAQGLPGVPVLEIPEILRRSEMVVFAVPDDALGELVTGLAAAGHVRRRRDEGDRRRVLVEHTDTARRDGQRAFQPMSQRLSAALEGFSVAELRAAVRVLEAATAALTDPTPEDP